MFSFNLICYLVDIENLSLRNTAIIPQSEWEHIERVSWVEPPSFLSSSVVPSLYFFTLPRLAYTVTGSRKVLHTLFTQLRWIYKQWDENNYFGILLKFSLGNSKLLNTSFSPFICIQSQLIEQIFPKIIIFTFNVTIGANVCELTVSTVSHYFLFRQGFGLGFPADL